MQELVRLALLVARALAATQPPRPRVHPFRVAAGLVTVLLCLVTAGGCLLAALWLYLLPYLGPVGTPLVLAGALLIKAGVILLWLRLHLKRHSAANAPSSAAAELAPALAEVEQIVRTHKLSSLSAALLTGLALGTRRD